jgi:hypothetical protein
MSEEVFDDIISRVEFHVIRILKGRANDTEHLKEYLTKLECAYVECDGHFKDETRIALRKPPSRDNLFRVCVMYIIALLNPRLGVYDKHCETFAKIDFTHSAKASTLLVVFATMNVSNMDIVEKQIVKILEHDMEEDYACVFVPLEQTMFVKKTHLSLLHDALTKAYKGWMPLELDTVVVNMRETAELLYSDDEAFMKKMNHDIERMDILDM